MISLLREKETEAESKKSLKRNDLQKYLSDSCPSTEVILFSSIQHLRDHLWSITGTSGLPNARQTWTHWSEPNGG